MKDKTCIALAVISAITILEAIALSKGIDGLLLSTVIAVFVQIANLAYNKTQSEIEYID